jgi:hypothetical protein
LLEELNWIIIRDLGLACGFKMELSILIMSAGFVNNSPGQGGLERRLRSEMHKYFTLLIQSERGSRVVIQPRSRHGEPPRVPDKQRTIEKSFRPLLRQYRD